MNLGFTKQDSRASVERNRGALLEKLGIGGKRAWPVVTLRQIHSDVIRCLDDVPEQMLVGDGVVTATPGRLLAIQTADCLPVIVVDAKRRAVGVFHAGWRGTVKRIVESDRG